MDIVDQVLSDLRQESCVFCHITATEPWHIDKSQSLVAPFYIMISECMRILCEGKKFELRTGVFLVLPQGSAHAVCGCGNITVSSIPMLTLFQQHGITPWSPGMRLRAVTFEIGGGGEASEFLIGLFYFGNPCQHPLLSALPPLMLISLRSFVFGLYKIALGSRKAYKHCI